MLPLPMILILHVLLCVYFAFMASFSVVGAAFDDHTTPLCDQLLCLSLDAWVGARRPLVKVDDFADAAFSQMVTSDRQRVEHIKQLVLDIDTRERVVW